MLLAMYPEETVQMREFYFLDESESEVVADSLQPGWL